MSPDPFPCRVGSENERDHTQTGSIVGKGRQRCMLTYFSQS